jgi:hypothetical protein
MPIGFGVLDKRGEAAPFILRGALPLGSRAVVLPAAGPVKISAVRQFEPEYTTRILPVRQSSLIRS